MTGNSALLDSNIVIEVFKGNSSVITFLENHNSLSVPFIVVGELYLGAFRSERKQK